MNKITLYCLSIIISNCKFVHGQQIITGIGKSAYSLYLNKRFFREDVYYKSKYFAVIGVEFNNISILGIKNNDAGMLLEYVSFISYVNSRHPTLPNNLYEFPHRTISASVYDYFYHLQSKNKLRVSLGAELSYTLNRDTGFDGCLENDNPYGRANNYNKWPSLAANVRMEYRIKCGGYNLLPKLILKIDLTDRISDCSLGPFIIAPRIDIGFQKVKK